LLVRCGTSANLEGLSCVGTRVSLRRQQPVDRFSHSCHSAQYITCWETQTTGSLSNREAEGQIRGQKISKSVAVPSFPASLVLLQLSRGQEVSEGMTRFGSC